MSVQAVPSCPYSQYVRRSDPKALFLTLRCSMYLEVPKSVQFVLCSSTARMCVLALSILQYRLIDISLADPPEGHLGFVWGVGSEPQER
jgi:hypothetical protein